MALGLLREEPRESDALPHYIPAFDPDLIPALHMAFETCQNLLTLQKLDIQLVLARHRGVESVVLTNVDVCLLLCVGKAFCGDIRDEDRLQVGERVQLGGPA